MIKMRKGIGLGGLVLLPIVCCVGLPLLVAAGASVAAFALIGGITVGALAFAAAIGLVVVRVRRRRACASAPTTTHIAGRSPEP